MQGEARLVMRLDRLRERGWKFEPNSDGTWNVFPPDYVRKEYDLDEKPSVGHHGLIVALAWVSGAEQALEWAKFAKAGMADDVSPDVGVGEGADT